MNATIERGLAVRRELQSLGRTSKKLFRAADLDTRDEFRKILRERQGVFSARLEFLLSLFVLSRNLLEEWGADIFTGAEAWTEKDEAVLKALFELWLSSAHMFHERADFYGRHGLPVDPAMRTKLSIFMSDAARVLRDWTRPALSLSLALRTRNLNPATKAELDALRRVKPA